MYTHINAFIHTNEWFFKDRERVTHTLPRTYVFIWLTSAVRHLRQGSVPKYIRNTRLFSIQLFCTDNRYGQTTFLPIRKASGNLFIYLSLGSLLLFDSFHISSVKFSTFPAKIANVLCHTNGNAVFQIFQLFWQRYIPLRTVSIHEIHEIHEILG